MGTVTIINGTSYTNGGSSLLSSSTNNWLNQEISKANNFKQRASTTAYENDVNKMLDRIDSSIQIWRIRKPVTNSVLQTNSGPFSGLPYKTDGAITVVVTAAIDFAGFDSDANRVLINPVFAQMVRDGEVAYKNGNTYKPITMTDVILHEIGHRVDGVSSYANAAPGGSWRNGHIDLVSEKLEMINQIITTNPTNPSLDGLFRIDHDNLYYKDGNGIWVDLTSLTPTEIIVRFPGLMDLNGGPSNAIYKALDGTYHVVSSIDGTTIKISGAGGDLGQLAGSTLGKYLARDDGAIVQIATSTVLGSIGEAFGDALSINLAVKDLSRSFEAAFSDFDQTLFNNLKNATVGALSSFTAMELGRVLGLKGFGAELFGQGAGTTVGPILDKVLSNISGGQGVFEGFDLKEIFGGNASFGDLLGAGISSFLGAKLGSLVISPNTTAGAALASLGSAAGAYALSAAGSKAIGGLAANIFGKLGSLGNVLGPGIGAFVGFVLGALLGKLFGKKKPRIPTASAEVFLDLSSTQYQLGAVTTSNNGNRDLVTNMAAVARDTLNVLVAQVVGGSPLYNTNVNSPTQTYGHYGNQIRAKFMGGNWVNFERADQAVDWGILNAIGETSIRGGDIFQKRVISSPAIDTVAALLGNLQLAYDYKSYLENREVINAMIADDPTSSFSAAWVVTLGRVDELGLNEFQATDFNAGLIGFSESFGFGFSATGGALGNGYENITLAFEGNNLRISTTDGSGPFGVLSGSNNISDPVLAAKSVLIPNFGSNVDYTVWTGQATSGNDIWIASGSGSAVTMDDTSTELQWVHIPPYGSYQIPVTVTGGDDIFVGSNFNDTLYGRAGWDWLDGGNGDDTIDGGDNDDVLLGGAGADKLLGGLGNDYLAGGSGNENGSKGLWGGDGDDVLVGGAGSDHQYGEAGNDTFIVEQDGGSIWDVHDGGAGLDTMSFERFSSGVNVNMATGANGTYSTQTYGDGYISIENLKGSQFNDQLYGDSGTNEIFGLGGNDQLFGQNGDDTLEGGLGADELNGGSGNDTASYLHSDAGVIVNLSNGVALGGHASGDTFVSIENIQGSRFNDQFTGTSGANVLSGLDGNDYFEMSGGNDTLDGGNGFDTLDASEASSALTLYFDAGYYDPYWGFNIPGAGWVASVNGLGTSTFTSIESFVGTAYADTISGGSGDEVFEGGAGNDALSGGAGSDSYIFGIGDGSDSITETSDGSNSIILKGDIDWRDVSIGGAAYYVSNGNLTVSIRGTSDQMVVGSNFSYVNSGSNAGNHNHKIKTLDLGGLSALDVDMIDWTPAGADSESGTTVYGLQNKADIIFSYGGNDTIYAAGNSTNYENRGNVIYAGDGNDTIFSSGGDDQFVFERGNGADTLNDTGGLDTIVMGPSVAAEDVIFEVITTNPGSSGFGATADLYIGLRDPSNANLTASQVADRIKIVGGGAKLVGLLYGAEIYNTIEYIRVAGQEIDLTKSDINWTESYYYDGTIFPVALDLDGDGIEMRSVEGSRIASVGDDGVVTRLGWVGPDDGFLALDRNGDGLIDRLSEISFVDDLEGAKSDLEGLAAYDSNGDGLFSADDERWGEFRVWQDKNQDGIGVGRELMSLNEAGVQSISLKGSPTGFTVADGVDNAILATTAITWTDSQRVGQGYDVVLSGLQVRTDGGGKTLADADAAARGKVRSDDLSDALYGVQGLTDEQAQALKEANTNGSNEGLLGRVEDFLGDTATKVSGGVLVAEEAAAVHDKGRALAIDGADRNARGKYASNEWTLDGSVERGEAAPVPDTPFKELTLSAEQQTIIEEARVRVAAEKDAAAAALADLQASESREAEQALDLTIPTARELADRAKTDSFRLLTTDTDAETEKLMRGDQRQADQAFNAEPRTDLDQSLPTSVTALPEDKEQRSLGVDSGDDDAIRLISNSESSASAPLAEPQPEAETPEFAYMVRIMTANAQLVQALASTTGGTPMLTDYQGLNVADNDAEANWLTVDALPSVHRLAAIA